MWHNSLELKQPFIRILRNLSPKLWGLFLSSGVALTTLHPPTFLWFIPSKASKGMRVNNIIKTKIRLERKHDQIFMSGNIKTWSRITCSEKESQLYLSRNGFSFLTNTTEKHDQLGPYDRGACLVHSEVCHAAVPACRWEQMDFSGFDAQQMLFTSWRPVSAKPRLRSPVGLITETWYSSWHCSWEQNGATS